MPPMTRPPVKQTQSTEQLEQQPQEPVQVLKQSKPIAVVGKDYIAHPNFQEAEVFCGLTFGGCNPSHFCNGCGSPAALMVKKWDSGKVIWNKFLCQSCSNKEQVSYIKQISE